MERSRSWPALDLVWCGRNHRWVSKWMTSSCSCPASIWRWKTANTAQSSHVQWHLSVYWIYEKSSYVCGCVAGFFFSLKHRVSEPRKEFTYNLKGTIIFLDITHSGCFSLLTRTSWKVPCTKMVFLLLAISFLTGTLEGGFRSGLTGFGTVPFVLHF